jgi:S1-C subfamily serine protease
MNTKLGKASTLAGLLLATLLATPAPADEISEKGRVIFNEHHTAVVTIQVVLKNKVTMSGRTPQARESRQDVSGTVIDPSGLTVVSLSSVDPSSLVQALMSEDVKMESELADVKILTEDGGEIPAEVVLRDKDLDMAFLRPKAKPENPMKSVDAKNSGKAEVLDVVIALNRLGNAAGRAYSASVERISGIVSRPRMFYIPDANMTTSGLGCPAFTLDGKFLGVLVTRAIRGDNSGGGSSLNAQSGNFTGIILPASEVLKAAAQVPAVGAEKK